MTWAERRNAQAKKNFIINYIEKVSTPLINKKKIIIVILFVKLTAYFYFYPSDFY